MNWHGKYIRKRRKPASVHIRALNASVLQLLVELGYIVIPFCLVEVASNGVTEVVFLSKLSGLPAGSTLGRHAHSWLVTCQLPRLLINCVYMYYVCMCGHRGKCISAQYQGAF